MDNQGMEDQNEIRLQNAATAIGKTLLNKDETKREASRLLLEGWTMLGDNCPISEYPLFRNKKTGEVWSVRLQMPVQTKETAAPPTAIRTQNNEHLQTLNMKTTKQIVRTSSNDEPQPAKKANDVSKVIGAKLLLGWEMLDEDIDGCPLMMDPISGRKWLPTSGQYVSDAAESRPASQPVRNPSEAEVTPPGVSQPEYDGNSAMNTSGASSDLEEEISQRISEKMLMGWSMLYEHCPVRKTCPLLLDPRSGKKWSAALNRYLEDSDFKKPTVGHGEQVVPTSSSQNDLLKSVRSQEGNELDLAVANLKQLIVRWSQDLERETDLAICRTIMELMRDAALTIRELDHTNK